MTPTEFVLWLNGALGVMDDTPTPEQMTKIREKLGETIGKITADRLLERADEQVKRDKERAEKEAEMAKVQAQMQAMMSQKMAQLGAYTAKLNEHSPMLEVEKGKLLGLAPGTIIAESPSPSKSGGILGSLLRPAAKARA